MISVRLTADISDFFNSMNTAGLDSFVVPVLGIFVSVETVCLLMLMKVIAGEGKMTKRFLPEFSDIRIRNSVLTDDLQMNTIEIPNFSKGFED